MANSAITNLINTNATQQGGTDRITGSEVRAIMHAINAFVEDSISYNTAITFTSMVAIMAPHTVSAAITFSKNTTGAVAGAGTLLRLTANGTNTPNFSAFKKSSASKDWNNTNGVVNVVVFFFDGVEYWYFIWQDISVAGGLPALPAPSGFTATAASQTLINLAWADIASESSYTIDYSTDGGANWFNLTNPAANSTTANHANLSAGTTIHYRLKAKGDGVSNTDSVYIYANASTQAAQQQLATPGAFFDQITSSTMRLTAAAVPNAQTYRKEIATDAAFTNVFAYAEGSVNTTFSSLTQGTTYYGRMKAMAPGYLDSAWGTTSATTTSAVDNTPPVIVSASISNSLHTRISLLYNEALAAGSLATGKFSVMVNGVAATISTVIVNSGMPTVVLVDLAAPIFMLDVVTISYTPGSSGARIADTAGNFAIAFTNVAVTNNVIGIPEKDKVAEWKHTQGISTVSGAVNTWDAVSGDSALQWQAPSGNRPPSHGTDGIDFGDDGNAAMELASALVIPGNCTVYVKAVPKAYDLEILGNSATGGFMLFSNPSTFQIGPNAQKVGGPWFIEDTGNFGTLDEINTYAFEWDGVRNGYVAYWKNGVKEYSRAAGFSTPTSTLR